MRNYIQQQSVGVVNEDKVCTKTFLVMLFFPQRIGRVSYFIRHCAIGLLVWGIVGSGLLQKYEDTGWILVLICFIYQLLWVVLPRMRDLRMRTFWILLSPVPLINVIFGLILLFRPRAIAWPRSTDTPESHDGPPDGATNE